MISKNIITLYLQVTDIFGQLQAILGIAFMSIHMTETLISDIDILVMLPDSIFEKLLKTINCHEA